MSAQVASPAPLNVARARRLTKQLRETLTLALDLLVEVFEGRAWEALGHPTWEAYCAAELPELAELALPLEQRQSAVATLRGRGLSLRAIGAPLGLSPQTVQRDLKAAGVQLATVTSLDGRQRPAAVAARPSTPAPAKTSLDRVVDLVAAAGPDGLTVREVLKKARNWHHGQASGALSRAHAQGRLVRTTSYRTGCAAYVIPASAGE